MDEGGLYEYHAITYINQNNNIQIRPVGVDDEEDRRRQPVAERVSPTRGITQARETNRIIFFHRGNSKSDCLSANFSKGGKFTTRHHV